MKSCGKRPTNQMQFLKKLLFTMLVDFTRDNIPENRLDLKEFVYLLFSTSKRFHSRYSPEPTS